MTVASIPALLAENDIPCGAGGGRDLHLVVHGARDDLVPISQGRALVTALREHGAAVSLLELPHDDHGLGSVWGAAFDEREAPPTPAMREIAEFFVLRLGPVE